MESKESRVYIVLLIVLSIFMVRAGIGLYNIQYPGDATSYFFPSASVIKEAFLDGVMPLWNPYIMSGTPLLAKAQLPVLSLYSVIQVLMPMPYLAMTINVFVHLIILGLGIYFLSRAVGLEEKYAFVSSLVCMLSAYVSGSMFFTTFQFMGLAFFPYVLLFVIMALKKREWVRYAILGGVFVSMEFLSGAFEVFTFSWWVVLYILAFNLIGRHFSRRLLKSVFFGIIFSVVAIGIISIKLFPAVELTNISQRQQPFDYERSLGSHVNMGNAFHILVDERKLPNFIDHVTKGEDTVSIGIIASLLVLISVANFRKRRYLFFLGMTVLAILMITNSPWNWILWKYFPYFNKQKHVLKAQFVFLVTASILTAYGARYLISKVKNKKFARIGYIALVVALVLTSWGFTFDAKLKDARPELGGVEIMKYMAEDDGMFRFKAWETNGIDWGTNYYSIYYRLEDIYGYENLWLIDYLPVFLSVANREPAKLFGMLNMKYMTSKEEIDIPGFELVKKFDDNLVGCEYTDTNDIVDFDKMKQCPGYSHLAKAWGPYLYLNKLFLPRAYFVENSILVVGEEGAKMQIVYGLMLDNGFKPENTVIIVGKESVNDYGVDDLKKYSAVFLTQGSVDENSGFILKNYVDNGGILLPNIVEGESSVDGEIIGGMLHSFEGELNAVDYVEHNLNKYEANLDGVNGGFLVLSEKFSMFPGWNVEGDGQRLEIEKADGVISAVYVDKPYEEIVFEYKPRSYVKGRNITIFTLILVILYFGYYFYVKRKKKDHHGKESLRKTINTEKIQ